MSSAEQVEALLLHLRPYRETSAIVDFITSRDQHIRAICKGVRGQGKNALLTRAALQPFTPVAMSYSGKSELKTLRYAESAGVAWQLKGRLLYSALYLNELVLKLCTIEGAAPGIYRSYYNTIQLLAKLPLQDKTQLEITLRQFEFELLAAVGYGYDWNVAGDTGAPLIAENFYGFDPQRGFVSAREWSGKRQLSENSIPGSALLAISNQDFSDDATRRYAKLIVRQMLKPLLGEKPLKARELFI